MILAAALILSTIPLSHCCGCTVMEKKMDYVLELSALQRRWGPMFDAAAGAMLVIAPDDRPSLSDMAMMVVAAAFYAPNTAMTDLSGLVMTVATAVEGGQREALAAMIAAGSPRDHATVWSTVGCMVQMVRQVCGLGEAAVDRLIPVIRIIGDHPLMRLD